MVSKARDDLPDPESPVKTTNWSRGISTERFLRLCTRAPCTRIVGDMGSIYRCLVQRQSLEIGLEALTVQRWQIIAKHGGLFEEQIPRGGEHGLLHPSDFQVEVIGQAILQRGDPVDPIERLERRLAAQATEDIRHVLPHP